MTKNTFNVVFWWHHFPAFNYGFPSVSPDFLVPSLLFYSRVKFIVYRMRGLDGRWVLKLRRWWWKLAVAVIPHLAPRFWWMERLWCRKKIEFIHLAVPTHPQSHRAPIIMGGTCKWFKRYVCVSPFECKIKIKRRTNGGKRIIKLPCARRHRRSVPSAQCGAAIRDAKQRRKQQKYDCKIIRGNKNTPEKK